MTTNDEMLAALLRKQPQPSSVAQPAKLPQPTKQKIDWPIVAGKLAVWLALASFGGIVWTINGGFSVLGLEVISLSFNDAGKVFWSAMTQWSFALPIATDALPGTQPVLPWCGVVSSSILQVAVLYLTLKKRPVPQWLLIAATDASIYDYGTTLFGLNVTSWLRGASWIIKCIFALIITFLLEVTLSFMLFLGLRKS